MGGFMIGAVAAIVGGALARRPAAAGAPLGRSLRSISASYSAVFSLR